MKNLSASPLLQTKLHMPTPRPGVVTRPRLCGRLSEWVESGLTLLSAPAGFGKTTLLTEWLASPETKGWSRAWLSLDRRDNDPALYWAYVVAALDSAVPGVGTNASALLAVPQPSTEAVLSTLVNDISGLSSDLVLVLDDYHVIESPEVQDGMCFLLDHLPPQLRLVIASRADPAMPLARLRARGQLLEIRVADLRFNSNEASAYLNGALGFELDRADVNALEGRTEGWIAALQLAALSMKGRDDISSFIEAFAGDDRYIVDYLAEEVLQRQTEHVRTFLLLTSILSRLHGPLCDAVTGQTAGKAMLESLDRANLFLVPLDDRRNWYRYHHLFADVLRARLLDEEAELVQALHLRACDWYDRNGERFEAIHHALAGKHFERAADLVEHAIPAALRDRREATLCGWLDLLPESLFEVRPVLNVGYLGALMSTGQIELAEPRLQAAERWLDRHQGVGEERGASATLVVADPDQLPELPASIEMYRAAQALLRGDPQTTVIHARRAIELSPDGDHLPRAGATALLALASWSNGDLDQAHSAYSQSRAMMQRVGHTSDVLGCSLALADIELAQGALSGAKRTYEHALQLTGTKGGAAVRGTADMHVGLSGVYLERNDLQAAKQHLLLSQELGGHAGLPQNPYRSRVALAQLRRAEGDHEGAIALLDEAQRVYTGDYLPNVRPIPARRAQMDAARDAVDDALRWARDSGRRTDEALSYLHEYEHMTLGRVLLAEHAEGGGHQSLEAAMKLLERLLVAAEQGRRTRSVIEILVLRALAHQARGDMPAALAALEQAATMAEPEGHVRLFLDEGKPIVPLLTALAKRASPGQYARRLLIAAGAGGQNSPRNRGLVDPLSSRERDVLRLLASDLTGPDIARELVVSLSTVRTHTKNIYLKLGVNTRRAAVRLAGELDLLAGARGG